MEVEYRKARLCKENSLKRYATMPSRDTDPLSDQLTAELLSFRVATVVCRTSKH